MGTSFAILSHDTEVRTPDLNVHVDILAEAMGKLAAREMAERFAGVYNACGDRAELNMTDGLGIVVEGLVLDGVDVLADVAGKMRLAQAEDLDMRL